MPAGISVTTIGVDSLARVLSDIANIPQSVQAEMVDAMSTVVRDAQVYTAATMLQGPYYRGDIAASVTKSKVKRLKSGPCVDIEFRGESHGNRNAEIAFVNEYGKRSQPARPFIKTANELSDKPSLAAGFSVYEQWLKTKGV